MRFAGNGKAMAGLLTGCLLLGLLPAGAVPVHADVHSIYSETYVQDMEGNLYEEDGGYVRSAGQADAGDEVSFLAVPREGYRVTSVILTDSIYGETDVTFRSSFTMPESDARITAVFRPRAEELCRSVSVNGGGAEYVLDAGKANPVYMAEPGEKIYAGVRPENAPEGMYCTGVYGDGITVNDDGSFIMPDADVFLEPAYDWQTAVEIDTENGTVQPEGMEKKLRMSLALAAEQGRIRLTDAWSGQPVDAGAAEDTVLYSGADLAADLDMDGQADVRLSDFRMADTCSVSEPELTVSASGAPCSPITFSFAVPEEETGEEEEPAEGAESGFAGDGDTGQEGTGQEGTGQEGAGQDDWQDAGGQEENGSGGSGQDGWEQYGNGSDGWEDAGGQNMQSEEPSYSGPEQPEPDSSAGTPQPQVITVETDGYDGPYNGQPHFLTVTPTDPAEGAVVRYGAEEGDYSLESSPLNTDAGTYTVYYQVTAEGYETLTGSEDIVIAPADGLTVEAKGWKGEYDGQPHEAGAEVSITEGTTVTYSTDDGDTWSEDVPVLTDPGTLAFRVKAENRNYKTASAEGTLEIAEAPKKTIRIVTDGYNGPYNGQPHFLTVTPTDPAEGAVVRYGAEEGDYSLESSPLNTDAGTYTVYYQVTAEGYETLTGSEDIVIAPADGLTVEAKGWKGEYDGQPHEAGAEVSIAEGTTVTYSTDAGDTWTEDAPVLTEPGTLDFLVQAENPNYETASAEGALEIAEAPEKTIQIVSDGYSGPYNGQPHFLTVTPTDPAEGAVVLYGAEEGDYSLENSPQYTDAGTYTVYYQVTAEGYETLTGSEDVVIEPADGLTVEAKGWKGEFDGQPHEAGAAVNISEGTVIWYSTDDGSSWTKQAPSRTEPGTLPFRVKAENPNYKTAEAEGTLEITEAQEKTIQVTTDGYNGPYNGEPHFLTVTPTNPETGAVVRYGTEEGSCTMETSPRYTDAGTYSIYYQVTADGYKTLTDSEDIVIAPMDGLDVTAQGYSGTYDGRTHTAGAAVNITEGTTVSFSTDGGSTWTETAPSRKDAGTLPFKVRAMKKNYETAYADGSISIGKAPLKIETGKASKAYDGKPLTSSEIYVNGKAPANGVAALVNGETISVKTTGSQTNTGTSSNTCAVNWGSTNRNNYELTLTMGTLTVTGKGVYTCTYGNGSVKRKGTDATLEFIFKRTQNDETAYSHFQDILVDGSAPDSSAYTARSGSVVISLQAAYLNALAAGDHTLTANFDDGDPVTVKFTIQDGAAVITPTAAGTVTPTPVSARPASTGDNSHILWWAGLLALAAAAFAGAMFAKKRYE